MTGAGIEPATSNTEVHADYTTAPLLLSVRIPLKIAYSKVHLITIVFIHFEDVVKTIQKKK